VHFDLDISFINFRYLPGLHFAWGFHIALLGAPGITLAHVYRNPRSLCGAAVRTFRRPWMLAVLLFALTATHGILDAYERRRLGYCILLTIRPSALFFALAADSHVADWRR